MTEYPLIVESGLMYARLDGGDWIVDTGSPRTFGDGAISLDGVEVRVSSSLAGTNASKLSSEFGHKITGLIGTELLNELDVVLDVNAGKVTFSKSQVELPGSIVPLDFVLGVPIAQVKVAGTVSRAFLDTGAQISYMPSELISAFPTMGVYQDSHPQFGRFESETHSVDMEMGGERYTIRCGCAPSLISLALGMADASGIIGSAVFCDRRVGYFARRRQLVLG